MTTATILRPDFVANAVGIGYRYSDVRAKTYGLADYRRALTVHPSQITVADMAGPFKAIYARRYAAWDDRVVYGVDNTPIGW